MRSLARLYVLAWTVASLVACSDDGLLLGSRMDGAGQPPPSDVIQPQQHTGGPGGPGATTDGATTTDVTTTDATISTADAAGPRDAGTDGPTIITGNADGGVLDFGEKLCNDEGWCWFSPLPQGNTISAVWANGPSDVWGVGTLGMILHRDATKWSMMQSGTTRDLTSVWASGPDDAWAVGKWGTLIHWNGAAWLPVDRVYDDGGDLTTVWGSSPTDVWVGGSNLFHYDGRSWTKTTLDVGGPSCIWGTSANDVWASGGAGMAHWDGKAWTKNDNAIFPDADAGRYGVVVSRMWGSGPNDVWGAGGPVIHWDGTAWSKVGTLGMSAYTGWGTGPNDAWVAGSNGYNGAMSHWDGATWTQPSFLDPAHTNNPGVNALWGFAWNDVWLMGDYGVTAHNDGTGWTRGTQNPVGVSGIWGSAADDVWAVGGGGALHWDGSKVTPTSLGTNFTSISGLAKNDIWASSYNSVLHWDGVGWSVSLGSGYAGLPNGNGNFPVVSITSVWATSPTDVWAVGIQGFIEHFDGVQWTRYPLDGFAAGLTRGDLRSVWASGPNDAWVTGDEVAHWDGKAWTKWPDQGPSTGSGGQLYGVALWGSARDDVWLADGWENLRHFDGTSWSTVPLGAPGGIQHVWGRGRNDVWASGGWFSGTAIAPFVMHYDGNRWWQSNIGITSFQDTGWTSPTGEVWVGSSGLLHHDPFPGAGALPPSDCSSGGWCWQHPLPQGNPLHAVHANAANDVWAVGDNGTALHYDGRAWTSHTIPNSIPYEPFRLNGVWSTDPLSTWAIGSRGVVAFWDGGSWHYETGASGGVDSMATALTGVWASSPTDIWVVGYNPNQSGGSGTIPLLARTPNSGGSGQLPINSSPRPIATTGIGSDALYGIWGFGPSDVWVCGNGGAWHWDGGAWTFGTGSNVGVRLLAMWGSGPSDVWAVGMFGKTLHWTGASWTDVPNGASLWSVDVTSVWGSGPNDVWAGTVDGSVMHWTGSAWSPLSQLANVAPAGLSAAAISGTSASNIWVVGGGGMMQHFDGSTWSDSSHDRQTLTGLWGSGPNDVWAVGGGGFASETLHWDGTSWMSTPNNTAWSLEGVWGRASNDVYAVGVGGILNWTGSSWSVRTELGAQHYAGWGSDTGELWAVGAGGKYSRYDGQAWTTGVIAASGGGDLHSIWGSAANDVWAVGDAGILHWNGGAWSLAQSGPAWAIWGNSANDVWAVAGGSTNTDGAWHWDGKTWSTYGVTTAGRLFAVGGRASNDVWAAGEGGSIVHWDGRVWTQTESATLNTLTSVFAAASGGTWIAGENGTILYRP